MAYNRVGYQPRTTPAERRADLDQRRIVAELREQVEATDQPVIVDLDTNLSNFISNKSGPANFDGAIHFEVRSAGTTIGRITRATSTTAGFLTSSDEDLKENLGPIDDDLALQWMRTIEPLFFNYKEIPDVRHVGYSAQRVAAAWPNGVANGIVTPGWGNIEDRTWDEDGNETTPYEVWQAWMMDHSKITPILHAGLQTIDRIVTDRTAVLADHEDRIASLEQIVTAQADQIAALQQTVITLDASLTALQEQIVDLRAEVFYTRQATMLYDCSTATTLPPANGQVRINAAATQIYVHRIDRGGYNRQAWLDFIVAATNQKSNGVRIRMRGAQGAVYELRTNSLATYTATGTYYTIPVSVVSGTVTKGFDVELTVLTEIWAEDPPPIPNPQST